MAARKKTHTEYDQVVAWHSIKASMVCKSHNGPAPEYLSSKFIGRPDNTPYAFRDSANILQDTINKYCKIK